MKNAKTLPYSVSAALRHALKSVLWAMVPWLLYLWHANWLGSLFDTLTLHYAIPAAVEHCLLAVMVLVYVWFLCSYTDKNDEIDFAHAVETNVDTPLLHRPEYIVSTVLGALLTAFPLYAPLRPLFPTEASPLLAYFLGALLFFAMRLFSLWLHRNWQKSQAALGKERATPLLSRRLIHFVLLLCSLAITLPIAVFFLSMIASFFLELTLRFIYIGIAIALVFLFIHLGKRIRIVLMRAKMMRRLRALEKRGAITLEYEGHPYLSALANSFVFELTVKTKSGKRYRCATVFCKKRRVPLVLGESIYYFVHGFHVRRNQMVRAGGTAGTYVGGFRMLDNGMGTTLFEFHSKWKLQFPEGDGEKILLITNPAVWCYVEGDTKGRRPIDNGVQIFDYCTWTPGAFVNFLDRSEL